MTVILNHCTEDWAQMEGTEATRYCARCATHVTDVDMLEDAEVLALLQQRPRCMRARVDRSGRVLRLVALAGAVALAASELIGEAPAPASTQPTGAAQAATAEAPVAPGPAAVPAAVPADVQQLRVWGYIE